MSLVDANTVFSADRPLTVLVFFRGDWCPFCQGYLRELDGSFREQLEAAGGRLVGVTSQFAEGATRALEGWGLHYDVVSEPSNALAERFGAAITPKAQTALADHPTEYPNGMAQPAVVAVDASGKVVYSWAIVPSEMNLGGATDRPLPAEVWAGIQAGLTGGAAPAPGSERLDVDFLAENYPEQHKTFLAWVAAAQAAK